ncbi:DUF3293 domain-containing protein [Dyella soli]|uniref:DUF3293 domain-containing protein n=1 Tax=Dyella soli TaxID=522319 RepID=A0A4R0YSM1_9GAMM|nr:DUF3293 domain-containing protein [Dyella soli]TCI09823.1 DUF3293 domain-containing protein [Dyella soli]
MDEHLLAAFRATDYRVRLAGGGSASIRIDLPLPAPLRQLVGPRPWGFITAWNPRSQPRSREANRQAQRQLLSALRQRADTLGVSVGLGVGSNGWKEPSLLVVGPPTDALDQLARRFGQLGYVHGVGDGPAGLRLLSWP